MKIYRYLVNDKPDEQKLFVELPLYNNNRYDIKKLLEDIFTSDWFYAEKISAHISNRLLNYWAGIRRFIPLAPKMIIHSCWFRKVLGRYCSFSTKCRLAWWEKLD